MAIRAINSICSKGQKGQLGITNCLMVVARVNISRIMPSSVMVCSLMMSCVMVRSVMMCCVMVCSVIGTSVDAHVVVVVVVVEMMPRVVVGPDAQGIEHNVQRRPCFLCMYMYACMSLLLYMCVCMHACVLMCL